MKTNQTTAHLIHGPTAAGKSTYAPPLATDGNGVRFATVDAMHGLLGHVPLFHFVDADLHICRQRVLRRHDGKGETCSFDLTPGMFNAMESYFEPPTEAELWGSKLVKGAQQ